MDGSGIVSAKEAIDEVKRETILEEREKP